MKYGQTLRKSIKFLKYPNMIMSIYSFELTARNMIYQIQVKSN